MTAEPPLLPDVLQRVRDELGMKFVLIPKGEHWIGSREQLGFTEPPRHQIKLTRTFWMATTPVTQHQWQALMTTDIHAQMEKHKDSPAGVGPEHPMYSVDWMESVKYCNHMNRRFEKAEQQDDWIPAKKDASISPELLAKRGGFRLPTETEWEAACRAGSQTEYWSGDGEAALAEVGWYTANSKGTTQPVATKQANPLGLHDMHGNVWEWCLDHWRKSIPRELADLAEDPLAHHQGSAPYRVIRGGSWVITATRCRSAVRCGIHPADALHYQGFRPVWVPSPESRAQDPKGQVAEAERAQRGTSEASAAGAAEVLAAYTFASEASNISKNGNHDMSLSEYLFDPIVPKREETSRVLSSENTFLKSFFEEESNGAWHNITRIVLGKLDPKEGEVICEGLTIPRWPDNVTNIHLWHCPSLTELPEEWPSGLLEVDIRGCENLKAIPKLPSSVRHIDVSGCKQLTSIGLPDKLELESFFAEECPRLGNIREVVEKTLEDGTWPKTLQQFGVSGADCFTELAKCSVGPLLRGAVKENTAADFRAFHSAAQAGEPVLRARAKALFLGDGFAGKTTLVWRLMKMAQELENSDRAPGRPPEKKDRTHGFQLFDLMARLRCQLTPGHLAVRNFNLEKKGGFYLVPGRMSLWDFGGQELYHRTHRLFTQEGTVFVLVFNPRAAEKYAPIESRGYNRKRPLEYWLDYIGIDPNPDHDLAEQNKRVLVVCTESSEATENEDRKALKESLGRFEPLIYNEDNIFFVDSMPNAAAEDPKNFRAGGAFFRFWTALLKAGGSEAERQGLIAPELYDHVEQRTDKAIRLCQILLETKQTQMEDRKKMLESEGFTAEAAGLVTVKKVEALLNNSAVMEEPEWVASLQDHAAELGCTLETWKDAFGSHCAARSITRWLHRSGTVFWARHLDPMVFISQRFIVEKLYGHLNDTQRTIIRAQGGVFPGDSILGGDGTSNPVIDFMLACGICAPWKDGFYIGLESNLLPSYSDVLVALNEAKQGFLNEHTCAPEICSPLSSGKKIGEGDFRNFLAWCVKEYPLEDMLLWQDGIAFRGVIRAREDTSGSKQDRTPDVPFRATVFWSAIAPENYEGRLYWRVHTTDPERFKAAFKECFVSSSPLNSFGQEEKDLHISWRPADLSTAGYSEGEDLDTFTQHWFEIITRHGDFEVGISHRGVDVKHAEALYNELTKVGISPFWYGDLTPKIRKAEKNSRIIINHLRKVDVLICLISNPYLEADMENRYCAEEFAEALSRDSDNAILIPVNRTKGPDLVDDISSTMDFFWLEFRDRFNRVEEEFPHIPEGYQALRKLYHKAKFAANALYDSIGNEDIPDVFRNAAKGEKAPWNYPALAKELAKRLGKGPK